MELYCIYGLLDKNGLVFYVGMSKQPEVRFLSHKTIFGKEIDYFIIDGIEGTKKQAFLLEIKWIRSFIDGGHKLINTAGVVEIGESVPAHIDKDVMKDIRKFVANNGGSIRKVLEKGAIWVMTKGAKEYIESLKK